MIFKLPELGEAVQEAELVAWRVNVGDVVRRGQPLMEVMTDKATMEVPAPFEGRITALKASPGHRVAVGEGVLSYQAVDTPTPVAQAAPVAPSARTETLSRTDAPPVVEVAHAAEPPPSNGTNRASTAPPPRPTASPSSPRKQAAPVVRRLARELGLDLDAIPASKTAEGIDRVRLEDLARVLRERAGAVAGSFPSGEPPVAKRDAAAVSSKARGGPAKRNEFGEPGQVIPYIGLRRKIGDRMVEAKRTIPHASYVEECDLTALVALRSQIKEAMIQRGVRLTYTPFIIKAVARALIDVPIMNATLDETAGRITLHNERHVGVAVSAPSGLVVPVLRHADRRPLPALCRDLERLSRAVRDGSITREDLTGGTFTVTSIGNIGGLFTAPILNIPQVGILGVGRIVRRPVYDDQDRIRPADLVYLSITFDHRVVDGAAAAEFGNAVVRHLSEPTLLLTEFDEPSRV
ncbi:catalytic domain-containing protein of components of various dehydrogenase complexes [Isosphaera pallida ATCC 43644]|uniref:Dihydrolipoamide acetyltransferase component of pyruvate dehydrogenase complex n=1 Tax=Isosphaera pallida (strain ATCC 43644 / DSM 9630 / IS1B) TaxID=575540 RepID=E8QYN5_ISOPI|nr:dihydrolipoamide acetyltransferase family protein [Isosphaera pallida]ADV61011.1 catalytic domain-containing protein of components of various dehydrogenase complexes [Isosphaera pallida ATCC 43644]